MVALTVVLPVHNGEAYLDEAITSIRNQTFQDFELLVIDDRSDDRSATIAAAHAAGDARIRVLANSGEGLVAALNFGISHATSNLIARMDADDVALPTRFERQLARMAAEPDLQVLGTATLRIDADGKQVDVTRPPLEPPEVLRLLDRVNPIAHPTVVMRRDAVEAVGGYRRAYLRAEDYDLWLRLAERGKLANLGEPLLRYRLAGPFRADLFSRQVLSEMAARAAAGLRRKGSADPSGEWDAVDIARLATVGVDAPQIAAETARRSLQMARFFRKLNDRDSFRAAVRLADEQPRTGLGEAARHFVRRARLYL